LEHLELGSDGGPIPLGPPTSSSSLDAILADIATANSTPFIGRAEELGRLVELLDRADQGRRAVALVAGDAGVGKTRLLAELADRAERRGARVLFGGCMESGDVGLPYVPFVDAFRDLGARPEDVELIDELAGTVPNLGRLLPTLGNERVPARPSNDEFEQVELFSGVLSLLMRLSEPAPLVLVIEDLHWADRSTRDLLDFLVRTLRSGHLTLIVTYRSDELHRRHPLRPLLSELVRNTEIERIELRPFNRTELAEHLEALTGERVAGPALDRILARSEGNAFFAEQLVAAGAIRGDVVLPGTLVDVLRDRIEAIPEDARDILKVASVAGRRVSHRLLVAAAGRPEDELELGLREAIARQVLVADPATETYRFHHALLQEAVYADLLPGERGRLHAIYARLMAESGPAAELAHHCLASHDLPGALGALVRAASDAMAVSAPAEAFGHLTHAIELWEKVPDAAGVAGVDRIDLLLKAATAAGDSGEFRRAVALAREAAAALEVGHGDLRAAYVYECLAGHLLQTGSYEKGSPQGGVAGAATRSEAVATFRRAEELVPPHPPTALRARVTGGLARALAGETHYDEARKWCDEALAVAKAAGAAEEETHALITLAILEQRRNNPIVARSLLGEAQALAAAAGSRSQQLRAQSNLAALELDVGDLPAACTTLDEAVAMAERTGLTWSEYGITSGVMRIFANYAAGRWDEAEGLVAELDDHLPSAAVMSAAALFVEVGRGRTSAASRLERLERQWDEDEWIAYLGGGCSTDLAQWQGDLDGARAMAQRTIGALEAVGEAWELSVIWPATLGLAAEADRAERARADGDEVAESEAKTTGAALLERARRAEERARSVGRQIGPEAIAWLARGEAEWTRLDGDSDPDRWQASADAFGYGYVYEEARSRWRLAEALLAAGDRDNAAVAAGAAHEVAERLGAEPLRARIEELVRRGRLEVASVAPSAGAAGLTPRELEVLRLVAEGRTNQQIADVLFISRKTASVHVSNILAKLGVRTRVEAAASAHRLGLDGADTPEESTTG
jgi:DNA-binding CsgD family transcriptional regulator/tetratricopeptide (TPR) repeat protein